MKTNAHYLLEKIYKEHRSNYAAAAYFLGLPNARSLEYYIKKQRDIPVSIYELMLEKCPDVSAEWLMRNEGSFERDMVPQAEKTPLLDQDDIRSIMISGDTKIKDMCKHYSLPIQADYLLTLHTDEMLPLYPKGCILALRADTYEYIQWGRYYMILTNQGFLFRRVEESNKSGFLILASDNEKYSDIEIDVKTIIGKAVVVGKIEME